MKLKLRKRLDFQDPAFFELDPRKMVSPDLNCVTRPNLGFPICEFRFVPFHDPPKPEWLLERGQNLRYLPFRVPKPQISRFRGPKRSKIEVQTPFFKVQGSKIRVLGVHILNNILIAVVVRKPQFWTSKRGYMHSRKGVPSNTFIYPRPGKTPEFCIFWTLSNHVFGPLFLDPFETVKKVKIQDSRKPWTLIRSRI